MNKIDKIAAAHEAWKAATKKRPGNRLTAEGEEALMEAWPYLMGLAAWAVGTLHLKEQGYEAGNPSTGADRRDTGTGTD